MIGESGRRVGGYASDTACHAVRGVGGYALTAAAHLLPSRVGVRRLHGPSCARPKSSLTRRAGKTWLGVRSRADPEPMAAPSTQEHVPTIDLHMPRALIPTSSACGALTTPPRHGRQQQQRWPSHFRRFSRGQRWQQPGCYRRVSMRVSSSFFHTDLTGVPLAQL